TYKVRPFISFTITFSFLLIFPEREMAFHVSPISRTCPETSRVSSVSAVFPIRDFAPETGFALCAYKPIVIKKRKKKAEKAVTEIITLHDKETKFPVELVLNKIIDPSKTEIVPPMANKP